jgi:hypothetical protein
MKLCNLLQLLNSLDTNDIPKKSHWLIPSIQGDTKFIINRKEKEKLHISNTDYAVVSYGIWLCVPQYICAYVTNELSKIIMVDNLDNYLQIFSTITSLLTLFTSVLESSTCDISSVF